MVLTGDSLVKALQKDFENSKFSINVISAYVTKDASKMLVDIPSPEIMKVVVGRFTPRDFLSGASSLEALKYLVERNITVKALKNLHAKIYQIDNSKIYAGSANFTKNGLCLVGEGNLEATFEIAYSQETDEFIQKVICAGIELNQEKLRKMEEFLELLDQEGDMDTEQEWPEDIMPSIEEIFVSDFPLSKPGESHKSYQTNPALEFAVIEKLTQNTELAAEKFKNSKAYHWLKQTIKDNESDRDLSFGAISQLLHDALSDDPTPYRRDIKSIQANLYAYVKLYAADEMEIYVPGRRSEVIRLVAS